MAQGFDPDPRTGFRHWSQERVDPRPRPPDFAQAILRRLSDLYWQNEHLTAQNNRILDLLHTILNRETRMDTELTTLTNAVEAEGSVVDSAIVLLEQLVADIEAEKNDPIAIQAIVDSVNAQKQKLTDAIVANTPAAPPANDGTGVDNPNAGEGDTPVAGDGSISGDAPVVTDETPPADPDVPATSDTNDGTV